MNMCFQGTLQDDGDLEEAFGVLRFGEIFSFCSSGIEDRIGRIYTERDYDCKRQSTPAKTSKSKLTFFYSLVWINYSADLKRVIYVFDYTDEYGKVCSKQTYRRM